MTQVNLLPWREKAEQIQKIQFMLRAAGFVVLAILAIIIVHFYYRSTINKQLERNNYIESELAQEQQQLNKLNAINKEMTEINAALTFLLGLKQQSYRAVEFLDVLARITPEAVALTKIERIGNDITIIGKTKSDAQISLMIGNMTKNKIFKQPDLTQIAAKESTSGDERIFQIKVTQQE